MLNIVIETIPGDEQKYPTVGNWFWEGDRLIIQVTEMGDWRHEFLVAMHELDEVMLCKHRGISEEEVTRFDIEYESKHGDDDTEPGDDPSAPYYNEHQHAMQIEESLMDELEVDPDEYDEALNKAWEDSGHGAGNAA